MSIDDEVKAIESIRAAEQRTISTVTASLLSLVKNVGPILNCFLPEGTKLPDPVLMTAIGGIEFLEKVREKRSDDYSSSLVDALRRKVERIESGEFKLTAGHIEYIKTELMPLIIAGHDRAQQINSEDKIKRLAKIPANSLEVMAPADDVEEMMRIVADVDAFDVVVLKELHKMRFAGDRYEGPGPGHGVNPTYFERAGMVQSVDVAQSSCLKLQSFGLVVAQNAGFKCLLKGKCFLEFTGVIPTEQ